MTYLVGVCAVLFMIGCPIIWIAGALVWLGVNGQSALFTATAVTLVIGGLWLRWHR